MIVITGATGALNGATVEHLLKRIPADEIAVSVRDTAKAQSFADRGVRVRRGSYEDPAALLDSFEGADQVLLVSSSDPVADGVGLLRVGIDTAVAAGARRVLYTSHQHTGLDSPFFPARHHAATEALLAQSGVAWTSLRNGFYAHSLDWLLGPWRETGVIATPADGPVSWTERADEAEAAAVILGRPATLRRAGHSHRQRRRDVRRNRGHGLRAHRPRHPARRRGRREVGGRAGRPGHSRRTWPGSCSASSRRPGRDASRVSTRSSATSSAVGRVRCATCWPSGWRPEASTSGPGLRPAPIA